MHLISVITINYNNRKGLERTIKSVQDQTAANYEHLIIDGNSNDGSKDVIDRFKESFAYWVSEDDSGIYNAMNKGIRASKGDFLFFLNSGDVFYSKSVLSEATNVFLSNRDIYYCNIIVIDNKGNKTFRKHPDVLKFSFFFKKTIAHQAAFIKRTLFDQVFLYNENFKIVSDWEFFICAIIKHNASYQYVNITTVEYDDAFGISSLKENKPIRLQERQIVLKRDFCAFIEDYKELETLKSESNSHFNRQIKKVSKSYYGKRILLMVTFVLSRLLFSHSSFLKSDK